MVRVLGISGSLRTGPYNTGLLPAAQTSPPDDRVIEDAALHGIPHYDGDLEACDGIPEVVECLKARSLDSDALLRTTPECNTGIPHLFKNAINWISRPGSGIPALSGDRRVAVAGASLGDFGTFLSQSAWLPVLRTLGGRHWAGARLLVSRAGQAFNDNDTLLDDTVRAWPGGFVQGFAAQIRATR